MSKIFASVTTNVGKREKKNQDNFYLNGKIFPDNGKLNIRRKTECEQGVFAVADGMGGFSHGEYASMQAVQVLDSFLNDSKLDNMEMAKLYVSFANDKIYKKIKETGEKMGTTIAVVSIYDNRVKGYNVGDSRIYLYRDKIITQISKDHTIIARMLADNLISKEAAKNDKRRHQLYQNIGMSPDEPEISVFESPEFIFEPGDIILICSDGVHDVLDDRDIEQIISSNKDIEELSYEIVEEALNKGSKDNITAMILHREDKGKKVLNFFSWILGIILSAALGIVAGLIALSL